MFKPGDKLVIINDDNRYDSHNVIVRNKLKKGDKVIFGYHTISYDYYDYAAVKNEKGIFYPCVVPMECLALAKNEPIKSHLPDFL